jgi:hypothetical protein
MRPLSWRPPIAPVLWYCRLQCRRERQNNAVRRLGLAVEVKTALASGAGFRSLIVSRNERATGTATFADRLGGYFSS